MAPDGNLSSFEPEDVEFGCGWNGEPKALFEAREACRRAAELIRRYATAGDLVTAEPDRDMIDAGLMELVHELTRRAVQYS